MKKYVAVEAVFDTEGYLMPTAVLWEDGRRFEILRVTDVRRRASMRAGGTGIRYRCVIGLRETDLFFEDPRWFVDCRESM